MSVSITADAASYEEMRRALRAYADKTRKEHAYICNRAAMNVAFRSAQFTQKAAKSDILKGVRDPRALFAVQLRRQGQPIPSNFAAYVQKLISRRMSSIAFLKSGWIPAARALAAVVRKGALSISAASFGRQRPSFGSVKVATGIGAQCYAEITNSAVNPKDPTSEQAMDKYGKPANEAALRFVSADMLRFCNEVYSAAALEYNRKGKA